jgi:PPK2 family polyphosphate:nucleotide phosphotransferase
MFTAAPHPLLVPFDGSFAPRQAKTSPEKDDKTKEWENLLDEEVKSLGNLQQQLYADGRYAVLVIFQALDAAGKDGTIRNVFTGVDPCGLRVTSFKQPSRTELAHDFLWRTTAALPERGTIGIFNRSYYEEVLVARVHPEILAAQRLPVDATADLWGNRYRAIVEHERHLAAQGTIVLKFWLNVSKDEQRQRFLDRIDDPDKHWKFRVGDLDDRDRWPDYMDAYGDALNATSRPWAPWYAIPADSKVYMRWQVASIVNAALRGLKLSFPHSSASDLAVLAEARARLTKD